MGLLRKVTTDNFYTPKELLDSALEFTESLPSWFNPKWLGRVFKRLGFKEKRRYGKGIQYRLIPAQIQDIADRLNIRLPRDVLLDQWDLDFQEYWEKWLVTVRKIEECHKRNAGIPWVDPESQDYDPAIDQPQETEPPKPPKEPEPEKPPYEQLVCYWCQKPLMNLDWEQSDFTEGKPAHIECNKTKRSGLREQEQTQQDYGEHGGGTACSHWRRLTNKEISGHFSNEKKVTLRKIWGAP